MNVIVLFIILNIANVIIQTVKSIATIKCGKVVASLVNAVAYGLYTYVVFFTASDGIDLHTKAIITAVANLIGVFVVKYFEEKKRKDRLWKVELAVPCGRECEVHELIKKANISYNFVDVGEWIIFNGYCKTRHESSEMTKIAKLVGGKISAYESKPIF